MVFAKEMVEAQKTLETLGHQIMLPITTQQCLTQDGLNEDLEFCLANDVMKDHFKKIAESDAIIVLNYPKKDVVGYIGGSALMEIAVARHLDKKIFLLHQAPDEKDLRYAFEIKVAQPIILEGDLTNINNYLC